MNASTHQSSERLHENLLSARGDTADVIEDLGSIAGLLRQAYDCMYAKERVEILASAVQMANDLLESSADLKSSIVDLLDQSKEADDA